MKRIAILGGAFDPIHNDHVRIGYGLMYMGLVDSVQFSPCFRHKFAKDMAPAKHRVNMTCLATTDAREKYGMNFQTSLEEVHAKFNGSTYEYVTQVLAANRRPHEEFYFVIGSDNASNIHKFHEYQKLIQAIPIIVIRRDEYLADGYEWFMNSPHKYVDLPIQGLSSTLIRNTVLEKGYDGIKEMVSESVYNYILQHNLYK